MNHDVDTDLPAIDASALSEHIVQGDVFLLDVRRSSHGRQIYGALQYDPQKLLDAPKLTLPLPHSGLIVIYDEDGSSRQAREIGRKFAASGFGEIRLLTGGFSAYDAAGGKTEERTLEQPVPLVSEHQLDR